MSQIKAILFDWDNTLSNQAELGSKKRTLAFKEQVSRTIKFLNTHGCKVYITSVHTNPHAIRDCFSGDPQLQELQFQYITASNNSDRVGVLDRIAENHSLSKNQVCLVDDSRTNCRQAVTSGYQVVCAADSVSEDGLSIIDDAAINQTHISSIGNKGLFLNSPIQQYLRTRDQHLGFFSRNFDYARGKNRAERYLQLLANHTNDFEQTALLHTLLMTDNGVQLKKQTYEALGFNTLSEAREVLSGEIAHQINFMYTTVEERDLALDRYHKLCNTIIQYTNSHKKYNQSDITVLFNTFNSAIFAQKPESSVSSSVNTNIKDPVQPINPVYDAWLKRANKDTPEDLLNKFEYLKTFTIGKDLFAGSREMVDNVIYCSNSIKGNKHTFRNVLAFIDWLKKTIGIDIVEDKVEHETDHISVKTIIKSIPDEAIIELNRRYNRNEVPNFSEFNDNMNVETRPSIF